MSKPPLPSSSAKDTVRIALLFWIEWLAAFFVLVALWVFLEAKIGKGAVVTFVVLGSVLLLVLVARLVRKVITLRNQKGPMRGGPLQAFWAVLFLPAVVLPALGHVLVGVETRRRSEAMSGEARTALMALHSSEESFRRDFGRYTFNLRELTLGLREGERVYVVGFPTACSIKEGASVEKSSTMGFEAPLTEARKLAIEEFFLKVRNAEDCRNPKEGFEAYAVGVLKEGAPLDIWRVDEGGELEHLRNGL